MSETGLASPRFTRLEGAILAVILLVAVALRVAEAVSTPLWFDELYTRAVSARPLAQVLALARGDVHPPLHFLVVWGWHTIGGDGDLWLRTSSILCGLGAIAAAWALARALFGRWAAGTTAALLTLQPMHVRISQELRSYPQLWLLLTLAALGAWRWHHGRRPGDATLFVVAAVLALWTHYLAGVVLFVIGLWGLAVSVSDRGRLFGWAGLLAAAVAGFTPQLPVWRAQLQRVGSDHWLQPPGVGEMLDLLRHGSYGAIYLTPVLLALAAFAFRRGRRRRAATFAALAGPGTVLLCFLLNQGGVRLFSLRYMLFALPFACALVAGGLVQLPRAWMRALAVVLLLTAAARSAVLVSHDWEADDLARLRAHLAPRVRPGEVVFHADTHTYLFGLRYLPAATHRLVLVKPLRYFEGAAIVDPAARTGLPDLRRRALAGESWWGLATRQPGTDVRPVSAAYDSLANSRRFGVFTLWRPQAVPAAAVQ